MSHIDDAKEKLHQHLPRRRIVAMAMDIAEEFKSRLTA